MKKKKHKMNMTRPEFLDLFIDSYTEESIEKIIPEQSNLIYTMYSVLLESDLVRSNIEQVDYDDETAVVKLSSKAVAKEVRDNFQGETIRFGYETYEIHIKVDKAYLYVTLEKIADETEESE